MKGWRRTSNKKIILAVLVVIGLFLLLGSRTGTKTRPGGERQRELPQILDDMEERHPNVYNDPEFRKALKSCPVVTSWSEECPPEGCVNKNITLIISSYDRDLLKVGVANGFTENESITNIESNC